MVQDYYIHDYMNEFRSLIGSIDHVAIEHIVDALCRLKEERGRLFILGLGGSAGNASHMVNDMRKICGIEAYAPTDNVSELTARINDDGWNTCLARYMQGSRLTGTDMIFYLSVGGGSGTTSVPLVYAAEFGRRLGCAQYGIIGRNGGELAQILDRYVHIPNIEARFITPFVESAQAVVWHCIATHPMLKGKS